VSLHRQFDHISRSKVLYILYAFFFKPVFLPDVNATNKSTPRAAVANVYVASVAMGAKDEHTLRVFLEAEAYDGPSRIIAYSHCIAHGINMATAMSDQKLAVESGQWLLYRYNPERALHGENPLSLDSRTPTHKVEEFLQQQTGSRCSPKASRKTLIACGPRLSTMQVRALLSMNISLSEKCDSPSTRPRNQVPPTKYRPAKCDSDHNRLWRPSWPGIGSRRETRVMDSKEIAMMTLYRLVHLIETHSNELASALLNRVRSSDATPDYYLVPDEDLKDRVYEIYRHLGDWLITRDEFDLEPQYEKIGARRANQNIPFSQVAWAIVLTKDNLWEFLKLHSEMERPVEVFGELEMLELFDLFFDRAIYFAAVGYEKARTVMQVESMRATA
jgi:hypothetical protein